MWQIVEFPSFTLRSQWQPILKFFLNNLSLGNREYKGTQSLLMSNGNSTFITHTGNASIKGAKQLYLNILLREPHIEKNSINVSQCARDSNVFFEFHTK